MASELKVDKFTGVTTAGSIDVTGEGNSTTTNLQQGLAKAWVQLTMVKLLYSDSFNFQCIQIMVQEDHTLQLLTICLITIMLLQGWSR